MQNKIPELLKDIEQRHNIKILFAVENGSRSWRMDSSDSDYDVRFVFSRPLDEYIQIGTSADVIKDSFDKEGNRCPVQGCYIDIAGFDIIKFVRLLSSSNPQCVEWLTTDIVYVSPQNEVFIDFVKNHISLRSLYHHYKSMCRQNYLKYLKTGKEVTYKKYLYAMRGLVNAQWILYKGSIPPIKLVDAFSSDIGIVPSEIVTKLLNIIDLKKDGCEKDIVENDVKIDRFIENFLKVDRSDEIESGVRPMLNDLNDELRKIIIGGYNE